jgi:tripartite-type tricarboxylate transporter receptor subunit TctC
MNNRPLLRLLTIGLLSCVVFGAQAARAADPEPYPARAIRLIIPFPPGGSNDVVGRVLAAQLGERLGKTVLVDNRGGAGGVIGSEAVAKSDPDGYTLLFISAAFPANASLYKLSYDPIKSFVPVAPIASGPNVLVVNPKLPVNSVRELIALAKSKPGQLNIGSAGVGSFQHLGSELFNSMAGVNMVTVQYKGGGPAMMDAVAGTVQIMFGSLVQTLGQIRGGKLKPLGVGGSKRSATLPDVPTIHEAGVPGYEATNWWGIIAPAGTPPAIVARLHKEITAIQQSPEMQKRFQAEAVDALQMESAEFGRYIQAEIAKWGAVIKRAGIRAE